jgi:outer membrane biosynthesis protein TonB
LTLPGTVEPQPEPQPKPQPEPTPSPTIETTVITVVEPEPQPQPQPSETTVTTETKEAKKQTTLPTLEQIGKMTKPELIKYLTAYQQPTKGFSRDLKARLSNFVMSQQLNIKEQQQAA